MRFAKAASTVVAVLSSVGFFARLASASPVTVGDPSFENAGLTNYATLTGPSPWIYVDYNNEPNAFYHGLYVPTAADYTAGSDGLASGIVPDGTQVWRMGEGKILQVLPVTLAANQYFTVNVWVGTPTTDGSPAGGTSLALYAGTPKGSPNNNVNYLAGPSPASPPAGHWVDESFTLDTNAIASTNYGSSLELLLGNINENINVDFDDVTVTCGAHGTDTGAGCPAAGDPPAVPEPGTLALFGTGLVALALSFGRRRRHGAGAAIKTLAALAVVAVLPVASAEASTITITGTATAAVPTAADCTTAPTAATLEINDAGGVFFLTNGGCFMGGTGEITSGGSAFTNVSFSTYETSDSNAGAPSAAGEGSAASLHSVDPGYYFEDGVACDQPGGCNPEGFFGVEIGLTSLNPSLLANQILIDESTPFAGGSIDEKFVFTPETTQSIVPEPASLLLMGTGFCVVASLVRRKRRLGAN